MRFNPHATTHASGNMTYTPEGATLWTATEGQVVNAGVFLLAALTCWLVVPIFYAAFRYWRTANPRYILTDQRLLEESGIFVKRLETLELYRVKDLAMDNTLMQTMFGRGRIILRTSDATTPVATLNAIPQAVEVTTLLRDAVERCRVAKHVRSFDA
jgi:uncharacterized membrane protein YdbT with pleckstrin-like domain